MTSEPARITLATLDVSVIEPLSGAVAEALAVSLNCTRGSRGKHTKTTSPMTKALMVAGVAAAMVTALAGGAAGSAGSTPAPTTAVTATVTATPAPAVVSPDDPVDALTAWAACAVLSQAEYQPTAGSEMRPYDPAHPPTKNPDGSWQAIVGYPIVPEVEGAKSNIMICEIAGTLGAPKLIHWTMKDI